MAFARDDPGRNYVDDWPKPELLYALTPFEVVAGLRPPADAAAILRALAVDQLQPLASRLAAATSSAGSSALAGALASVLEWADPAGLVDAVVAACARVAVVGGPYADACAAVVRVAADHPGDIGLAALVLMRYEVLQPGQAVFMPAGGLHAYLRGTGIELLANSDNVVRSGLTGKHIDVPELLSAPRPVGLGAGALALRSRRRDHLVRYPGPGVPPLPARPHRNLGHPPRRRPANLAVPEGACVLRSASGQALELARGDSCFIPAADALVHATGSARLVLASPGAF